MKRKIAVSLAFALLLCLLFSSVACAQETEGYVADEAGLLSQSELAALEKTAAGISASYRCSAYIVTVEDYRAYTGGDVIDCAEAIYKGLDLGYGPERDGVLLLLSMEDRDYALIAYGTFGNAAFTDYGKERLCGEFLDDFAEDEWYDGFEDYLNVSARYMAAAREGSPVDRGSRGEMEWGTKLLIIVFIPCLIALGVCLVFRMQMKTAREKSTAHEYVVPGSEKLQVREDIFTHRTQQRVHIPKQNSSGGGTTVRSSGFSGRSGKF